MEKIKLRVIETDFAVCKITSLNEVDLNGEYVFISKTDDELSLVCEQTRIPPAVLKCEMGFAMLKICGTLDFALLGIIAGIAGVLAENSISVFVVSTYNTDHVLIKRMSLAKAAEVLKAAGYEVD